MKNILLCGFFGQNNLGDDLLLLEALSKIPKEFNIYIRISKKKNDILKEYVKYRDFKILNNYKDLYRRQYEYLIYAGGGQFPCIEYGFKDYLRFLLLRLRCKKIVVNGCGIVPKPNSIFFKMFIKQLYYCSVRDDISANFIRRIRKDVVNCGDLYWGNEKHYTNEHNLNKKCVVCLANPFSEKEKLIPHFRERYNLFLKNICEVIYTIKNKGFIIEYLPFYEEYDNELISDIQNIINSNDKILQRNIDYNIKDIDKIISQYQLGFCMRFHSILLAVKNNLPVVAINYDYKSESLLHEAGLEKFGTRFGVRNNQFFGKEIDLDMKSLYNSLIYATTEVDEYRIKASKFYKIKHNDVLKNYSRIFNYNNTNN